jgi:alkylated DNA repair dioxygenase AlkB
VGLKPQGFLYKASRRHIPGWNAIFRSHIGSMREESPVPDQQDLFSGHESAPLPGFRYAPNFVSEPEQQGLVSWIETLPLKPFEFQGFRGNRRVASFGLRYDYETQTVAGAPPIPEPLLALRTRAATWAGWDPSRIRQMLVTEYASGAPIGWHRDKPQFDEVLGISLLAPANFRLRRQNPSGWERRSVLLQPRSIYLLSGEVRRDWQHSIPPMTTLRYSITLRSLRADLNS